MIGAASVLVAAVVSDVLSANIGELGKCSAATGFPRIANETAKTPSVAAIPNKRRPAFICC